MFFNAVGTHTLLLGAFVSPEITESLVPFCGEEFSLPLVTHVTAKCCLAM